MDKIEETNLTLKDKCYGFQKLENRFLDADKPVILHLDGRSFSKMVKKKFKRPFDESFRKMMDATAKYLCEKIQGAVMAYVQSDEISLILRKPSEEGTIFFNGRICKLQSIAASMASGMFNKMALTNKLGTHMEDCVLGGQTYTFEDAVDIVAESPLYEFDCKAWNVPNENDAMAWVLLRNIDCIRNSKLQFAQSYIEGYIRRCEGLTSDDQIELALAETGHDWNDVDDYFKYGRFVIKEDVEMTREETGEKFSRSKFVVNDGFPLTVPENREKLKTIIFK